MSPLRNGDICLHVKHQPVFLQTNLPVWVDGIKRLHLLHISPPTLLKRNSPLVTSLPLCADWTSQMTWAIKHFIARSSRLWTSAPNNGDLRSIASSFLFRSVWGKSRYFFSIFLMRWWNLFLTPLSVRPGSNLAIDDHLDPQEWNKWNNAASSAIVHLSIFKVGFRWLMYRSLHCLPFRPGIDFAISGHFHGEALFSIVRRSNLSSYSGMPQMGLREWKGRRLRLHFHNQIWTRCYHLYYMTARLLLLRVITYYHKSITVIRVSHFPGIRLHIRVTLICDWQHHQHNSVLQLQKKEQTVCLFRTFSS